jgi:hypothetical protein
MTLRELYDEHPEWRDLPMVVYRPDDGDIDWVGGTAFVYPCDTELEPADDQPFPQPITVLVFAGN